MIKRNGERGSDELANKVASDCDSFYYFSNQSEPTWIQLDAMWASLSLRVPTLNGYSGNTPPGWRLGRESLIGAWMNKKPR